MKIAIPTCDDRVDNHFGHCKEYTVYTVENKQITGTKTVPSPEGCGCKSNIAFTLRQMGVNVMLAGNMGDGALNVLNAQNIMVIRGCSGNVKEVAESYLNGTLADSGIGCYHHECH